MKITSETVQAAVPVTIMKLEGELDASCYLDVIAAAKDLYDAGTRNLLLDMSDVSFMASSGLVALHSIVLLLRGEELPNLDDGWGAMHALAHDAEDSAGYETHCKILNPHPRVAKTLNLTGFDGFVQVLTDRETAVASFVA